MVLHDIIVGTDWWLLSRTETNRSAIVKDLEVINEIAAHIVNLDIDIAAEVLKVENHLTVVRIGNYCEVWCCNVLFFNAIE